ncbi:MAG: DUF2284 domain-containing protein, partial [Clostridia bacterium]|nr:DUF2284 domain-containing protein [Clostridia bacterium]
MTNFRKRFETVKEAAIIDTEILPFSEETVRACARNACGRYNTNWSCPPAAGKLEDQIKFCRSFPSALLFSSCYPLVDGFDLDGMDRARTAHTYLTDEVAAFYKVPPWRVFGAESCSVCLKCTYPHAPCRFPNQKRRTVESLGIDVVSLCDLVGFKYCNRANTETYFSMNVLNGRRI